MSAPWDALVGIAGGSVLGALLILLAAYVGKSVFDRGIARSAELQTALLERSLETHKALLSQAAEEQKNLLAQATAVDTDLRQRRIPFYTELWTLTKLLPKWPRAEGLTRQDLRKLSEGLRAWYFAGGGMFLSEESMAAYKQLQDGFAALLSEPVPPSTPIDDDEYDRFRTLCSGLRTELTDDIVSRRAPPQLAASRRRVPREEPPTA